MLADGQLGELVDGGDAPVESASALGGLGGVLGHVGGDPGIGEFPTGGDGPGVVLPAPAQRADGQPRGSRGVEMDGVGGLGDGSGEQAGFAVSWPNASSARLRIFFNQGARHDTRRKGAVWSGRSC